jgi:hypothetical protein
MLASGRAENLVNRCWRGGAISSVSTHESELLADICSPATVARSFSSAALLPLLRAFAAVLAGANGLTPWRFFVFNALGGIAWATVFGLGGYLLGASIHRVAGPVGWAMLILALAAVVVLWRYFKHHEERLLAAAEFEQAKYERR